MFGIVFVCVVKLEDRPSVRLEFRVCVCVCVCVQGCVCGCACLHMLREKER